MKVSDLMTSNPCCCKPTDALAVAARILWENDCGVVPVADGEGRLVGMITDRDACMAAYMRGRRFDEISIGSVMAHKVVACNPDDALVAAEATMQQLSVRRLPVVDAAGKLVGVISCNDLIRHAAGIADAGLRASTCVRLMGLLASIGASRKAALPTATAEATPTATATATTATATTTPAAAAVIPAMAPTPAKAKTPASTPATASTPTTAMVSSGKTKAKGKSKNKGR